MYNCESMTPKTLRAFRKRLNLTQEGFAKLVGVAPNTVARWERGEVGMHALRAAQIESLCQNTNLTPKKEE